MRLRVAGHSEISGVHDLEYSAHPAAGASALDLSELVPGFGTGAAPGRAVFTIRDLAKEFGLSARTLRFYEEKGLLDPARRGEQRLYTRRDRARLAYVIAGKAVGFSLEEVREMLDLYDLGDGQVTQLKVALAKFGERIARLERQKADIDRVVAELTRASDVMKAKLAVRAPASR
jgi:DNA-binding transcriptional MerR regulator